MATNPNPAHISESMWWFVQSCLALEPEDTVNAGTFGDKPGYHNSRAELLRDGLRNDYSIQLADDKLGPAEYGAAFDWTFRSAQGGDYRTIAKYGARIQKAFQNHDPRLRGWREVLIQADLDKQPEGFDFVSWATRVPDNTHRFHAHFSVLRRNIDNWRVYAGMLDILAGRERTLMLGLREGDKSPEVEFLQAMLVNAGYKVAIDGQYGKATSAAVLKLRQAMGSHASSGARIDAYACEQIYRAHAKAVAD